MATITTNNLDTDSAGVLNDEPCRPEIVKTLPEIKAILEQQKLPLAAQHGLHLIGIFGSYVRQEQRPDSDVDILVALDRPPRLSLLELIEIEYQLGDLLGIKADLVIKENLRARIGQQIMREIIFL